MIIIKEFKLTFRGVDEIFPVFIKLFNKPVGFVQLCFMGFNFVPEPRAVQVTLTELQRVQTHVLPVSFPSLMNVLGVCNGVWVCNKLPGYRNNQK